MAGYGAPTAVEDHSPGNCERGSLSIFTVLITLVVLVFFGAIVDFERKLEARHDANIAAEEAARAGACHIDRDRAYAHGGQLITDRPDAIRATQDYLRASGYTGSVTTAGVRRIEVTVSLTRPTIFLPLIGISSLHVTGTATAELTPGIGEPDEP